MKVFISWSDAESKSLAVARAVKDWLPSVINAVEPWISTEGLRAGLKWNQQLETELNGTSFGIIVVTPWNQHSQWLNFEAGALSKKVHAAESRVVPLLVDFEKATDLTGPLASYQATFPDKDGFKEIVLSINEALGDGGRAEGLLEESFKVCWPALEAALNDINKRMKPEKSPEDAPRPQPSERDAEDMLSEILGAIRDMARSDTRLKNTLTTATTALTKDDVRARTAKERRDADIARLRRVRELLRLDPDIELDKLKIRRSDNTLHVQTNKAVSPNVMTAITDELQLLPRVEEVTFQVVGPDPVLGEMEFERL